MQGFFDDLVGNVGTIEVAGVDMCDTQLHRLAQYGYSSGAVGGWAEHARACQLHRAVPYARDCQILGHGECSGGCSWQMTLFIC